MAILFVVSRHTIDPLPIASELNWELEMKVRNIDFHKDLYRHIATTDSRVIILTKLNVATTNIINNVNIHSSFVNGSLDQRLHCHPDDTTVVRVNTAPSPATHLIQHITPCSSRYKQTIFA